MTAIGNAQAVAGIASIGIAGFVTLWNLFKKKPAATSTSTSVAGAPIASSPSSPAAATTKTATHGSGKAAATVQPGAQEAAAVTVNAAPTE